VTLHFNEITTVELQDFQPGQAILSDLDITKATSAFRIEIGSSYGSNADTSQNELGQ